MDCTAGLCTDYQQPGVSLVLPGPRQRQHPKHGSGTGISGRIFDFVISWTDVFLVDGLDQLHRGAAGYQPIGVAG